MEELYNDLCHSAEKWSVLFGQNVLIGFPALAVVPDVRFVLKLISYYLFSISWKESSVSLHCNSQRFSTKERVQDKRVCSFSETWQDFFFLSY